MNTGRWGLAGSEHGQVGLAGSEHGQAVGLAGSEHGQVGLALKGHTVERTDGTKYLGTIIDSKL